MFETNEMARMKNPLSLLGDESHLWSHVTLRIHIPWFYVIYRMDYEDGSRKDIIFVSDIRHLINMINEPVLEIEQIYLVSPGHMNKRKKWLMEPLGKILIGKEPKHDQIAHIYVVEGGSTYVDSGLGSDEEVLREIRAIYSST